MLDQVRGDQEAGDHEENVNTNESASDALRQQMVDDDQSDGNGAQALDVEPEMCSRGRFARDLSLPNFWLLALLRGTGMKAGFRRPIWSARGRRYAAQESPIPGATATAGAPGTNGLVMWSRGDTGPSSVP